MRPRSRRTKTRRRPSQLASAFGGRHRRGAQGRSELKVCSCRVGGWRWTATSRRAGDGGDLVQLGARATRASGDGMAACRGARGCWAESRVTLALRCAIRRLREAPETRVETRAGRLAAAPTLGLALAVPCASFPACHSAPPSRAQVSKLKPAGVPTGIEPGESASLTSARAGRAGPPVSPGPRSEQSELQIVPSEREIRRRCRS